MIRPVLRIRPRAVLLCLALSLLVATASAITAPEKVRAGDTPGDGGGSITIKWQPVEGAVRYLIFRQVEGGEREQIAAIPVRGEVPKEYKYADEAVHDSLRYSYAVAAVASNGDQATSEPTAFVQSKPQWFRTNLTGVALGIILFTAVVIWYIAKARKGEELFVRKIAGLEAVEEAVGRATEMGRPVLYVPGTGYMSDIGTVASMNILGEVAKKVADYGTQISVPNRDPVVYTVAREVVRGAYTEAGRADIYDPKSVYFLVEHVLAYASAVSGIMVRERPATNFLLGPFGAESLILAETGASTQAIQIAGTDSVTQLPFFVVACDYTLMGEELYAASAYLAREPLMLGALKGQDAGKFFFLIFLITASIFSLFGIDAGWLLSTTGY